MLHVQREARPPQTVELHTEEAAYATCTHMAPCSSRLSSIRHPWLPVKDNVSLTVVVSLCMNYWAHPSIFSPTSQEAYCGESVQRLHQQQLKTLLETIHKQGLNSKMEKVELLEAAFCWSSSSLSPEEPAAHLQWVSHQLPCGDLGREKHTQPEGICCPSLRRKRVSSLLILRAECLNASSYWCVHM